MNERRRKWILSEKKASLAFFILKALSETSEAMRVLSGGLF